MSGLGLRTCSLTTPLCLHSGSVQPNISTAIADLSKGAVYMTKEAGTTASNAVDKATKNLGDLFKKKQ